MRDRLGLPTRFPEKISKPQYFRNYVVDLGKCSLTVLLFFVDVVFRRRLESYRVGFQGLYLFSIRGAIGE